MVERVAGRRDLISRLVLRLMNATNDVEQRKAYLLLVRGMAHYDMSAFEEADWDLSQAYELLPQQRVKDRTEIAYYLAFVKVRLGRPKEARRLATEARSGFVATGGDVAAADRILSDIGG